MKILLNDVDNSKIKHMNFNPKLDIFFLSSTLLNQISSSPLKRTLSIHCPRKQIEQKENDTTCSKDSN